MSDLLRHSGLLVFYKIFPRSASGGVNLTSVCVCVWVCVCVFIYIYIYTLVIYIYIYCMLYINEFTSRRKHLYIHTRACHYRKLLRERTMGLWIEGLRALGLWVFRKLKLKP